MKRLFLALLFACTFFVASAAADDVWDKKPSAEWSNNDAKRILEDSPWSNKWMTTEVKLQQTSSSSDSFDRETSKDMWYRAQFWSAQPIREARVRTMQFQMKYNQMNPDQKKQFDENAKQFIEAPFTDVIVIRVTYGSNVQDYDRKMLRFWGEQTFDLQKNFIILVADGKRIPITSLQHGPQGSQEFYVTFPRTVNGVPVIAGPDSKVGIEFQHPDVAGANLTSTAPPGTASTNTNVGNTGATTGTQLQPGRNSQKVWIQFKPKQMLYHGQMTY